MKHLLTAATLALALSAPALASDAEHMELCQTVYTYAETTMTNRLNGTPMPKAMQNLQDDTEAHKIMRRIVTDAYERPSYSTDKYKQRAIGDFANKWYSICYKEWK